MKYKLFEYELTESELRDCYREITGLDNDKDFNAQELVDYLTNSLMEQYDCGEFYLDGYLIDSWGYDEYKQQYEFYSNNALVCTIKEKIKDYKEFIKEYTNELTQWVRLIELFGDSED